MALRFPNRNPIGRPIIRRGVGGRAPIGREGGRGPVQVRPGGGNPPIRLRPKPPAPGPVRLRPGGGSGNPPIAIRPIPPRPGGGFPGQPIRPPGYGGGDMVPGPYRRDLRQGLNQQQYNRLLSGRTPGMEQGDFINFTPQERTQMAQGLHQVGNQWTSAPIYPGAPGGPVAYPGGDPNGPPRRFLPGNNAPVNFGTGNGLSDYNSALDMSKFLTQTAFAAQHPVDQALPPDHGLHPAQVQLLRDHYDANLLSQAAAQGAAGGGMGIMY